VLMSLEEQVPATNISDISNDKYRFLVRGLGAIEPLGISIQGKNVGMELIPEIWQHLLR
jgi:hypothetical protein